MSFATESLKSALLYDRQAGTLHLSPHAAQLGRASEVLLAAFGADVLLREVEEIARPEAVVVPAGWDMLCMQAVCDLFGQAQQHVYLEFMLSGTSVQTMLLLMPLPVTVSLARLFPEMPTETLPASGHLTEANVVVSYGLTSLDGLRNVKRYDEDQAAMVDAIIDLQGYPLQNSLQIFCHALAGVTAMVTPDLRNQALLARIPENLLPPTNQEPMVLEFRLNLAERWLVFEKWWNLPSPTEPEATTAVAVGQGTHFDLDDLTTSATYWLQALSTDNALIVSEAWIAAKSDTPKTKADFYPVRYHSRAPDQMALGAAGAALTTLLGSDGGGILTKLDRALPESVALLAYTFAPGEYIQLSFAAGDQADGAAHVVKLGSVVSLTEVDFTVNLPIGNHQVPAALEMTGWATFFGERFRVHLQPWTLIEGGLADMDGVQLGQLVEQATDVSLPFGLASLTLTDAWIRCILDEETRSPQSTELRLRLSGTVDLVPGAIQLKAIALAFTHGADGGNDVSFTGEFRLGPIKLTTNVTYDTGDWIFSGAARADDKGIPLTELVDHLVHTFGATVPPETPDVNLSALTLTYRTATNALQIDALTNWLIPDRVPVLGGSENMVRLALTLGRDSSAGGNQSSISIDWSLVKNGHQLTANAYLARETQHFSFDFSAPNPAEPVVLSDLTEELGLPDLPRPAAGVLDAIFQVSHFSLDYDHAAGHFATAWSRPLPGVGGLLLIEYDQTRSATADNSRQLDVSWLAEAEETIGIGDLFGLAGLSDGFGPLEDWLQLVGLSHILNDIEDVLSFRQLGFNWVESGANDVITFTAISNFPQGHYNPRGATARSNGTKAFVAIHRGQNQGVIAGLSLIEEPEAEAASGETQVAEPLLPDFLPDGVQSFIETVLELLDGVTITHLLVSTVNSRAYRPPKYSPQQLGPGVADTSTPASTPFGNGFVALSPGLALGIRVSLGDNDLLRKLVDFDELEGHLTLGQNFGLQCSIPKSVTLDAGGGASLMLTQPMLQLKTGAMGVEFDLGGALDVHLFDQVLNVQGWLSLSPEALLAHIKLEELPFDTPIGIPGLLGVHFVVDKDNPMYADIGIQFEPPGADIGFQAAFYICSARGPAHDYHGSVTLVLEIVEVLPVPVYLRFAMDAINLVTILEAVTGINYFLRLADEALEAVDDEVDGDVADAAGSVSDGIQAVQDGLAHIEAIVSKVELEDASFHWALGIINLPDGTTALPGVGFEGKLTLFDWRAYALLEFSFDGMPGITGHFQTEPLEMGGTVKISGDGKGMPHKPQDADDTIEDDAEDGEWYLKPGGPVLHLSTRSSPFLHANLHAELFGSTHADIKADVTDEGFEFDFDMASGDHTNGVSTHLNCHWWKDEGCFQASGDMGLHLHGTLGPIIPGLDFTEITLDTDLDGHVQLTVDSENFELILNGHFEYQGATLPIPELTIDYPIADLVHLVDTVWQHIKDLAHEIFEDFLAPVGEFIAEGAELVADVAVQAAHVVANVAGEATEEAKAIALKMDELTGGRLSAAADDAREEAERLKESAKAIVSGAAHAAEAFASDMVDAAHELADKALAVADEAMQAVEQLAAAAEKVFSDAVQYAEQLASEVGQAVTILLDNARRLAGAVVAAAWSTAADIAEQARLMVANIEHQIENLVQEIAELEHKIARLISGVEHAVVHAGGTVIHSASHGFGLW